MKKYEKLLKSWENLRDAVKYALKELEDFGSIEAVLELDEVIKHEEAQMKQD